MMDWEREKFLGIHWSKWEEEGKRGTIGDVR